MSWDTSPKTGLFFILLNSKRGNVAFPPPSPPCKVVPMFELPIENNKHPNFEWRGKGGSADSFVLWSYPIWVQCMNNFVADRWSYFRSMSASCIDAKIAFRSNINCNIGNKNILINFTRTVLIDKPISNRSQISKILPIDGGFFDNDELRMM